MSYLSIAIVGGMISLGTYQIFIEDGELQGAEPKISVSEPGISSTPVNYSNLVPENFNFTEAAKSTVDKVVHVKNVTTYSRPQSFFEYYFGQGSGETQKAVRGIGSGVIITPDGYIVTNHHVIKGASEVEITLNNNETYQAEVIGSAPDNDLALLKIDAQGLDYISFGDSDHINLGEWVLAVGNPFNLTSTVTAGIVSAKGRSLDESNNMIQSFIQTDAAVNPGNSGGALVNAKGELIGINTAITSRTGSYIGYSFAIPSNNVKKIVEDLIEYGNVQKAILGVRGTDITADNYKQFEDLEQTQGFYVAKVDDGSGAQKAGLQEKDVIIKLDDIKIRKFSDLSGFLSSKNPGDRVIVTYIRNGKVKTTTVTLEKYEYYRIKPVGIEVINADDEELNRFGVKNGVKINRIINERLKRSIPEGILITKINEEPVKNINDVKDIIKNKDPYENLSIKIIGKNGKSETYVFK